MIICYRRFINVKKSTNLDLQMISTPLNSIYKHFLTFLCDTNFWKWNKVTVLLFSYVSNLASCDGWMVKGDSKAWKGTLIWLCDQHEIRPRCRNSLPWKFSSQQKSRKNLQHIAIGMCRFAEMKKEKKCYLALFWQVLNYFKPFLIQASNSHILKKQLDFTIGHCCQINFLIDVPFHFQWIKDQNFHPQFSCWQK